MPKKEVWARALEKQTRWALGPNRQSLEWTKIDWLHHTPHESISGRNGETLIWKSFCNMCSQLLASALVSPSHCVTLTWLVWAIGKAMMLSEFPLIAMHLLTSTCSVLSFFQLNAVTCYAMVCSDMQFGKLGPFVNLAA